MHKCVDLRFEIGIGIVGSSCEGRIVVEGGRESKFVT